MFLPVVLLQGFTYLQTKHFTWVTESGRFPSSMAVALSVQIVGMVVKMG